ncbi:MAG: hypothetical protein GX924_02010 [Clostridiaceae bacterium]|nr:hypothetical protein [Clostridiaceae bacterium]
MKIYDRNKRWLAYILPAVLLIACVLLFLPKKDSVIKPGTWQGEFDFDEAVVYFLLTDRFYNGDPTNDDPNGENYDVSHPETYHGGDLQGIIDKLDYIQALGVNTIWVSPIVDNINFNVRHGKDAQYGYHGYWAKDFTTVDEHIGDIETLKMLVDAVHDRGMKLMVDVVINHAGYGMKETDQNPGIPNFPTKEEQAVFRGMLRLKPGSGAIEGELAGLPDFITEDPDVLNQVIDWQVGWIEKAKTSQGGTIDYFRVDTVKHVGLEELKAFKDAATLVKPDFKMIGEYFDGDIVSNGKVLELGGMDSVLDFSFKNTVREYLRGDFEQCEKILQNRNRMLTPQKTVGQFLSSHDEDGFLAVRLGGDTGLFKVAATLQITAKGQPVIYYGEEIGLSGKTARNMDKGEFSENRYDFDWKKTKNNPILEHYRALLAIRRQYSDLFSKGNRETVFFDEEAGISFFSRSYDGEKIVIGVNIATEARDHELSLGLDKGVKVVDLYNGKKYSADAEGKIPVTIPSKDDGGTVILKIETKTK